MMKFHDRHDFIYWLRACARSPTQSRDPYSGDAFNRAARDYVWHVFCCQWPAIVACALIGRE